MSEQTLTQEEMLARYVAMPEQLAAALADLSEDDLDLARDAASWSIRQIVHHIVDGDDLTKTIIKAALGGSGCEYCLDWYDPANTWADSLDYAGRAVESALALLAANHCHLEQLFRCLPDAWGRYVMLKRYRDSESKKVTAGQFLYGQTNHALGHIEEIHAIRQTHNV